MKKLNNKGITLAELIVSFAIVSVAVIYMYQTLLTINKMYASAKTDITDFSRETFALRMADKLIGKGIYSYTDNDKEGDWNISIAASSEDPIEGKTGKYVLYNVTIGKNCDVTPNNCQTYTLYRFINQ